MIKVWDQTQMLNRVVSLFLCLRNTLVLIQTQYCAVITDSPNVWFALEIN